MHRRTTTANQGQGPATSARGGGLAHRRTQDVRRDEQDLGARAVLAKDHASAGAARRPVPMTRAPRCASGEKQWEMQQGTIHGKHQVRGQPSICITNCAECDGARRRRSRRDDAGGNHARQRALDCPHQSTNDVGFGPFLTCSIATCDNDGGGAPKAVVIPPCNSAYTHVSQRFHLTTNHRQRRTNQWRAVTQPPRAEA
jgi:hypothetical protein